MERYRRASNKQLEYIAALYGQLDEVNPTLYKKYNMEDATRLITKLKRKLAKWAQHDDQTSLDL